MQGRKPIRYHPQRWVGFFTAWDPRLTEFIKTLPVCAWDRQAKAWWVPDGSEALLRAEAVNLGLITQAANTAWLDELRRQRVVNLHNGTSDHHDYAALGLLPDAPPELVALVYEYWKKELTFAGGAATKWYEIQTAFDFITGKTVV